jgi:hydrogenase/urease accessory protein HupE
VLLPSAEAHAHSVIPGTGDFWNGVFHPFVAIEQALALTALGLALARAGSSVTGRTLLVALTAIAGGLALSAAFAPPTVEPLRPAPLILGGLVLIDPAEIFSRQPLPFLVGLGVLLGLSMGLDIPSSTSWVLFAAGLELGSVVILAYAIEAWTRLYRPWFQIAVRIVGSWLVAIGVIFVGAALR